MPNETDQAPALTELIERIIAIGALSGDTFPWADGKGTPIVPSDDYRLFDRFPGTVTTMFTQPECDECGKPSQYGALSHGWCCEHRFPLHALGLGIAQRIVQISDVPQPVRDLVNRVRADYHDAPQEHTETIQVGWAPAMGHGPSGPTMIGQRPVMGTRTTVCGVRHHLPMPAVALPLCACGTYAIGRCVGCSKPVCGDDSDRRDSRRLCHERCAAEAAKAR